MNRDKNSVYIEFNGIPGCGKSTICNRLQECLVQAGCTVHFLQNDIAFYSRHKGKLLLLLLTETFRGKVGIFRRYINLYTVLPFESRKHLFAAYKNFILQQRACRCAASDYIISDQCLIQNILSCYHCHRIIDSKPLTDLLVAIGVAAAGTISIDAVLGIQEANQRITQRNTYGSRLDHMDSEARLQILETQIHNLAYLNEHTNSFIHIKVETTQPVEESVKTILCSIREEEQ